MMSRTAARTLLTGVVTMSAACSSTPSRPVEVTYRFEGVRTGVGGVGGAGVDEWSPIRGVLQKHAASAVREERRRRATVGGVEINDYRAWFTIDGFAVADALHADLEALAETSVGGSRLEFGLVDAAVLYRGNTVAAGVQLYVAGFATPGFRVKLFPSGDGDAIELTAGRNGMWSTKLPSAPEGGWLYGLSEDPAGKARTRYFRVALADQKQEQVGESEFLSMFPQARPAAAKPVPSKEKK